MPRVTASGRVNTPQDMSNLCRQCRRQTIFDQEEESLPECCEHCQKNPELALVTQACSIGLTQLAETLRSGIDSEKRGINPVSINKMLDSFIFFRGSIMLIVVRDLANSAYR